MKCTGQTTQSKISKVFIPKNKQAWFWFLKFVRESNTDAINRMIAKGTVLILGQ